MNIVLTNDDGLSSPGILLLAAALGRRNDDVYILAPDSNRSGFSHSISMGKPLRIEARGNRAWACSGTPVDCATIACFGGLGIKPDVIVSGINAGANLGTDITYSGTCAAARQGSLYGVPSIAFSLVSPEENYNWEGAVDFCAARFDEFYSLWTADIFLNVNIPNTAGASSETRFTFPSLRHYHDRLLRAGPDGMPLEGAFSPPVFSPPEGPGGADLIIDLGIIETREAEGSDCNAVDSDFVSVSPVFIHPVIRGGLYSDEAETGGPEGGGAEIVYSAARGG
ncbi:MAG: 5'/3'-nucleotidase SurE [Spirochaetaceae bacterium]|jgi:5'-nucleotidase|nr:5'/3'-nucleotidase SurE [Spirochaetaceae bacterium]